MNMLRNTLPPLTSLLPFEAAARLESFSKAADELHITQAAISRQIRALEQDLGVKLFVRRNRAVFLTDEGRALAEAVSTALRSISNQAVALRQTHGNDRVIFLCQLCEAFYWLMPRLARFHEQYPHLEVQVITSTRPLGEFTDHFDVALQTTGRASGPHAVCFTAADQVFPVCSPSYLAADTLLSLEELRLHTLLHYRSTPQDFIDWSDWLSAFGRAIAQDTPGKMFDSYPLMLQAAVAGHGVALGWRHSAGKLIEEGALIQVCAESIPLPDALCVYTAQGAAERAEVQALLAWLREELLKR